MGNLKTNLQLVKTMKNLKENHFVMSSVFMRLLSCTGGCVTRTTVKDEPRQQVRFASRNAAEMFYEAYLATYHSHDTRNQVAITFPLPYMHRTVNTDNVHFNAVVRKVDANHDGLISDEEAAEF